jgi:dTMP kinase
MWLNMKGTNMLNLKGKLIVIEGSDGSGKQTQSDMLVEALRAADVHVTYFDFPRYETSLGGRLVKDSLTGAFGDFVALHPKQASLPYAIDRAGARDNLVSALEHGVVVCNRYVPSNIGHQGGKFKDTKDQDEFIAWLEGLEYGELKLPRPVLTVFLHVPYDFSLKLMLAQGRALDQHESNKGHLTAAIGVYLRLGNERNDWCVVECVQDGALRTRKDIHSEIMRRIATLA